jgi:hypothetical protein
MSEDIIHIQKGYHSSAICWNYIFAFSGVSTNNPYESTCITCILIHSGETRENAKYRTSHEAVQAYDDLGITTIVADGHWHNNASQVSKAFVQEYPGNMIQLSGDVFDFSLISKYKEKK